MAENNHTYNRSNDQHQGNQADSYRQVETGGRAPQGGEEAERPTVERGRDSSQPERRERLFLCPQCGAAVNSRMSSCPTCGWQLSQRRQANGQQADQPSRAHQDERRGRSRQAARASYTGAQAQPTMQANSPNVRRRVVQPGQDSDRQARGGRASRDPRGGQPQQYRRQRPRGEQYHRSDESAAYRRGPSSPSPSGAYNVARGRREGGPSRSTGEHSRYAQRAPQDSRGQQGRAPLFNKAIAIAVIAVVVIGALFIFNPPVYNVTVNGESHQVTMGTTLQKLVDDGFASPKAGNLMAVDGSIATQGGGEPFKASINGGEQTSDPSTGVRRGDDVVFADGGNIEEPSEQATEVIPHGSSTSEITQESYYFGSIHLYSDGEDGEQVTKTGTVSGKKKTEVTKKPVDSGFHAYTADVGEDKVVAITFDDGPWPATTSEVLDVLEANDAHATFFVIGNQIEENADVFKRAYESGNQIGTHTYDHAAGSGGGVNLTYMSADEQVAEIEKGFDAIEKTLGTEVSHVMRAPGGNYYGSLVETLHPYVTAEFGWDVDTEDWSRPGAETIAKRIESVKPGQIILCHDGGGDRSQTVEALKTALPKLKEQGYSFVTVDELLKYGVSEASGEESGEDDDAAENTENNGNTGNAALGA